MIGVHICVRECVSVCVSGGGVLIFNGLSPYYFLSGLEVFAFGGILT